MARFGRVKKSPKAGTKNADPELLVLPTSDPRRAPRVSLPHVETQLNMHQYNGLFEIGSSEQQKTPAAVESSTESVITPASNGTNRTGSSNGTHTSTANDAATSEWSSAVGHAATGKSGRVIHNLQEEVARLTREMTLYRSRAEETQRMNDAFKTQVQNMTERLRNLEQANETNLHSISRKDKKIDELRAEMQGEKDRRTQAEGESRKFNQLMDAARDDFHRRCAEMQETSSHSQAQYDVLAKTRQREQVEHLKKLKLLRDDYISLKKHSDASVHQLERLDAMMADKDREIEQTRARFDNLFANYEAYKQAQDEEVGRLIENGRQGEARLDAALASLKETEGRMKWVLQVKNEIKDAQ
ncbi:hypothetical protein BO70DRAFT_164357 [Aspergillus heteromorphus CBS 117.55]|uniref:SWI5-dependent HO expression protein 3 n=1 Tax=Aspergillus heteromorphus CBS 117.55 TaxID=1448321 RepID=A0A317WVE7_9EURO|nr:uncharacterized protein BO70DRAFT_164357 [Aspergillus heteromorphus CBS 117.55]PWY89272.1 hypothetical protein BO70DRAFT_164357 [Aspergillus heteromorphus CBS 117.55]